MIAQFAYSNKLNKQSTKVINGRIVNLSWLSAHSEALCIMGILAFSAIFFLNLGKGILWAADEQTYSQMAYHMVKTGDYLTPGANGELAIWTGKPPLMMWLMSLSFQIFGVNNFGARFWSPIFGILSLIAIFYLGKKFYNIYVGFLSTIVLGTFTTYYAFATHAMTDVPLTFFILASILFLLLNENSKNDSRYAALGGLFFGLALMTKQVEALLIPIILVTYFAVSNRNLKFLFTKRFGVFLGIAALIFCPWVIYMYLRFGWNFWNCYFLYSFFSRAVSPIEGHGQSYFYYFNYLATSENLLWVILLPFAVGICAFNSIVKRLKGDTLILVWIAIVLAVFTFAQSKIYYYLLPAYPAFALAIAVLLYQLSRKIKLLGQLNNKIRLK